MIATLQIIGLILALASQLRFGIDIFIKSVLNLSMIGFLLYFFLISVKRFSGLQQTEQNKQIDLSDLNCTSVDNNVITRVQAGEKYSSIARSKGVSESAIKNRIGKIYTKLNVCNLFEFLSMYKNTTFLHSEGNEDSSEV